MSSANNPSRSGNQDDPWEQLAEDLFGLEYGKEHAAAPSPSESVPPSEPHGASAAAPGPEPAEPEPEDSVVLEAPPRFAYQAAEAQDFDETRGPETASESTGEEVSDFAAGAVPSGAPPTSAQDSYWDALANWNWDESEGGQRTRSEHRRAEEHRPDSGRAEHARPEPNRSESNRTEQGRPGGSHSPRGKERGRDEGRGRRGGERPPRHGGGAPAGGSTPAPARAAREAESRANDDFGLGVDSLQADFGAPSTSPASERAADDFGDEDVPASAADSGPAAAGSGARRDEFRGGEGEFPRKRRRRRRRRRGGRAPEGETTGGGPAAAAIPEADWDDASGPEVDVPPDVEPTAGAVGGPSSAEFSGERPARDARGRRHERRSDDERRGGSAEHGRPLDEDDADFEGPQEIVVAGGGAAGSELESSPEGAEDDASEEQNVSYDDVPTWEEAISYLLHPNQVQVEPASGGGGSPPSRGNPPADQPRQTRHIGHRKHRR